MRLRYTSLSGALLACLIGAVALIGWAIDIPILRTGLPELASMKANTALCVLLSGTSLLLLRARPERSILATGGIAAAALSLGIAVASLAPYGLGVDLGIDTLLFGQAALAEGAPVPGRMSPGTAVSLALFGASLLFLQRNVADWLALVPSSIAVVSIAGYLYATAVTGGPVSYTTLSVPTAVALLALGIGIITSRPTHGFAHLLVDTGPTGVVGRRTFPAAIGVPLAAGWITLEAERYGLIDREVAIGLMVAVSILALSVVARLTARALDASERHRKSAEIEYRDLFEGAPVGLFRTGPDGSLFDANPALARILGYSSRDSLLRGAEGTDETARRLIAAWADGVDEEDGLRTLETRITRPDGTERVVHITVRLLDQLEGRPAYRQGSVRDVTERWSLQEQLSQAQKMHAVGRLAGGVAHDFNNLLTVILGTAQMLRETPRDEAGREARDLDEIIGAATRGATLTRQLLALGRRQVLEPRNLDINEILREMETLLRRVIGEDVVLRTALAQALGTVRADPGQLEQVVMNLAINARDAMPTGGTLTLETRNAELDEDYARGHAGVSPGRFVVLAVSDDGMGMDRETRSHILEPFFTTKPRGRGTGLGLASVHGIVEQSGGHLWIYSEPGRGSTFKVYLPRVDEAPDEKVERQARRPVGGTETILVVEDEEPVRKIVARILGDLGYTVIVGRDVKSAREAASEYPASISLLLTDVVMPGGSGQTLADELRESRPDLKVLFMSGYTDDAMLQLGAAGPASAFLQKPFTRLELASRIREMLDDPKPPER